MDQQIYLGKALLREAMNGENWSLVTDEPVIVEYNRFKFKTLWKLPVNLEEYMEYTPN